MRSFLFSVCCCCLLRLADAEPTEGKAGFITGVSLSFRVRLPEQQFRKLLRSSSASFSSSSPLLPDSNDSPQLSCEQLDEKTAWVVGGEVDVLLRRIWAFYRARWLHSGLHEVIQAKRLPPPPVFIDCRGVIPGNDHAVELQHIRRDPNTPLNPEDLGKPIIPYSTPLGAMLSARALGLVDNQDLIDFANLVARADRALQPPGSPSSVRAARMYAYDAYSAATFFPFPSAALLHFHNSLQRSSWGLFGSQFEHTTCMQRMQAGVAELLLHPSSGSSYSEEDVQQATAAVSGLFSHTVCNMKKTLSHVCVAAQQEVEQAASEVALLTGKFLYPQGGCSLPTAPSSRPPSADPPQAPILNYFRELCASQPENCSKTVAFLRDVHTLTELRTRNAKAEEFSNALLEASKCRPLKNPNALLQLAQKNQGLLLALVRKPVAPPPAWRPLSRWGSLSVLVRKFRTCILATIEQQLQEQQQLQGQQQLQEQQQQGFLQEGEVFAKLPLKVYTRLAIPTRYLQTPRAANKV
ncbi:hypothetical protein Efla_004529 [Eimeria flavescens]